VTHLAHPNEQRLRDLYDAFSRGAMDAVLGYCSDDIVFHVPGRSQIAGSYTKAEFVPCLIARVMELSKGTFREAVDDVIANDRHGVVLATHTLDRDGKPCQYNTIHLWGIQDGRCIEWREHPQDLYVFDEVWG